MYKDEHGLRDHIRLLMPLFGFITAVWLLRFVLGAVGVSHWLLKAASVTVAASLAVLLSVLFIHVRRFGGYASVVMSSLLLVAWGQLLIVAAILFSVVTGLDNIYVAPEFSVPRDDNLHLRHILGHLTLGIGAGTLFGAGTGCLLLWLLRWLVPMEARE
ncbi:MAG: hypothetical protein L0229_12175 [Blastocatellia bacterium]|nr:hypothetical protein [Blastocatellia bacterium]